MLKSARHIKTTKFLYLRDNLNDHLWLSIFYLFDLNQPLANIGRTTFLWWVNGLHETEFLAWSFALVNRVGFFALSNEPSIRTTGFTLQSNSLEQNVVKWIYENTVDKHMSNFATEIKIILSNLQTRKLTQIKSKFVGLWAITFLMQPWWG